MQQITILINFTSPFISIELEILTHAFESGSIRIESIKHHISSISPAEVLDKPTKYETARYL